MAERAINAWRWYAQSLGRRKGLLLATAALTLLPALASLPVFWLIRRALDISIPSGAGRELVLVAIAIVLLRLLSMVPAMAFARMTNRAVRAVTEDLRNAVIVQLHRARWRDLPHVEAARAQSRVINDSERVDLMTQALCQRLGPAIPPILIYATVLFAISWRLALILAVLTPLLRALTWWSAVRLKASISAFQRAFERFHASTHHTVGMLRPTRIQGGEATATSAFAASTASLAEAGAEMGSASLVNHQLNAFAAVLTGASILALGGAFVIEGALSLGALAAFVAAAAQANAALSAITSSIPQVLSGRESLLRLAELSALAPASRREGALTPDFSGPLVLENVSFSWSSASVLRDVTIEIGPGEVVALAAANGEGKTTVLELVAGLLEPDGGAVRLGHASLAATDIGEYRARIGFLPQDPLFFSGSIRENIAFGRGDACDAAMARAVELAALAPLLSALPAGLETAMGDCGTTLSGGERQRIALARALLHGPELLILDEPSNHLDETAVSALVERLIHTSDRPTILMATHDPRLLAAADRIYDLADGRTHRRLPPRRVGAA